MAGNRNMEPVIQRIVAAELRFTKQVHSHDQHVRRWNQTDVTLESPGWQLRGGIRVTDMLSPMQQPYAQSGERGIASPRAGVPIPVPMRTAREYRNHAITKQQETDNRGRKRYIRW